MTNQQTQETGYLNQPQAYVFNGGIIQDPHGDFDFMGVLAPHQSEPLPSQLEKSAITVE